MGGEGASRARARIISNPRFWALPIALCYSWFNTNDGRVGVFDGVVKNANMESEQCRRANMRREGNAGVFVRSRHSVLGAWELLNSKVGPNSGKLYQ
jgi:hypothetical protein